MKDQDDELVEGLADGDMGTTYEGMEDTVFIIDLEELYLLDEFRLHFASSGSQEIEVSVASDMEDEFVIVNQDADEYVYDASNDNTVNIQFDETVARYIRLRFSDDFELGEWGMSGTLYNQGSGDPSPSPATSDEPSPSDGPYVPSASPSDIAPSASPTGENPSTEPSSPSASPNDPSTEPSVGESPSPAPSTGVFASASPTGSGIAASASPAVLPSATGGPVIQKKKVKITFNANRGRIKVGKKRRAKVVVKIFKGQKIRLKRAVRRRLVRPVRKGYRFRGWYTKRNKGGKRFRNKKITAKKNMRFYARWKRRK